MTIIKRLPLDRTILIGLETHIVDSVGRNRIMKETKAVPVRPDDIYVQTELVVSHTQSHTIQGIKKSLILKSMGSPFLMDLTIGTQVLTGLTCTGLFIWTGPIDSVRLYLPTPTDPSAPVPSQRISCQHV